MAAMVEGLMLHPSLVQERAELLGTQSFGDVGLDRLVGDLIRMTYDLQALGDGLLRSRLSAMGHSETMRRIDRIAGRAHAPFLEPDVPVGQAREYLMKAIDILLEVLALNRAVDEMKDDDRFDAASFSALKSQRDALDRLLSSGELWAEAPQTVH
jgi:DNA primase